MWLWYLKCCTEQNQTILTNDFVTKTQKCQSRSITRAQTHHSWSFTKYYNTILNIILWWDFTEAKQWLLGFFVSLPPLCLWHLAEHHAVVWTCLHRFLSWWTTIKRAKRSTKVLLLRQESLLDTGICSHLIKFIMMSRTIELVLYCINNATGLQHGLRYILTPASKYREVYVLCFFSACVLQRFSQLYYLIQLGTGFIQLLVVDCVLQSSSHFVPLLVLSQFFLFIFQGVQTLLDVFQQFIDLLSLPLWGKHTVDCFQVFLFVTPSPKVYKIKQYFCYRNNLMPRVTVMHNGDCDGNPTVLL